LFFGTHYDISKIFFCGFYWYFLKTLEQNWHAMEQNNEKLCFYNQVLEFILSLSQVEEYWIAKIAAPLCTIWKYKKTALLFEVSTSRDILGCKKNCDAEKVWTVPLNTCISKLSLYCCLRSRHCTAYLEEKNRSCSTLKAIAVILWLIPIGLVGPAWASETWHAFLVFYF